MKALAIVCLVLSICAIFIPAAAILVIWAALIGSAIAASDRDAMTFVVATLAFVAANLVFFSPILLLDFYQSPMKLAATVALFLAPIGVAIYRRNSSTVRMR